jgi:hypothetical protein
MASTATPIFVSRDAQIMLLRLITASFCLVSGALRITWLPDLVRALAGTLLFVRSSAVPVLAIRQTAIHEIRAGIRAPIIILAWIADHAVRVDPGASVGDTGHVF